MKTEQVLLTTTIRLTADVIACRFVGYDGTQAKVGKAAIGIAAYDANNGEPAAVHCIGIAPIEAGAAIAVGDAVAADDQGRAVTADGSAVTLGYAIDAATAAGEFIRVKLGG